MTDNIKIERYKELLIRKDTLQKECDLLWLQYAKEFGALLKELFQLKIDCITLKKKIAYVQSKQSRQESINFYELEQRIQSELTDYYKALKEIGKAQEEETVSLPKNVVLQIKKLYRKIASLIHPDLHPELFQRKDVQELWLKAKNAYASNDLNALQDAEFLILQAIENDPSTDCPAIENVDERIADLQQKIAQIISSQAYQSKFILEDPSLVAEEQQELQEEIASYQTYKKTLQERFDELQDRIVQLNAEEVYS